MAAATIFPAIPSVDSTRSSRLWLPKRVYVTRAAQDWDYGRQVALRAEENGSEVVYLSTDRLPRIEAGNARKLYAEAKSTLAVVVAPPSSLKLNPIPPSADWQFHLAQGCPAHCQYCYLAGSLSGPPITRVYANLDEILENLRNYLGTGHITSRSRKRSEEGTTFEASCYTDPLALEHLTGGLAKAISFFGRWNEHVQLRWTTKFAGVEPLLALSHGGRTRVRFSVNAREVARNFEGGTDSVDARLDAMRRMAQAGYPVGLTIAPIVAFPGWQDGYTELFRQAAHRLSDIKHLDLTAELITHRFTPKSKDILLQWYPRTPLDMEESKREQKRTKFGGVKYVYPAEEMKEMKTALQSALTKILPQAQILYWT